MDTLRARKSKSNWGLENQERSAGNESRVILATGSYIGEGFDDARLDTLFLAMPISWKGTLQPYVGRLHRLDDNKRFVQVYDKGFSSEVKMRLASCLVHWSAR